jgi:hypothetical protein
MRNRLGFRLVVSVLMIAMVAGVAVYSYNVGVAHGIVESGRVLAAPGNVVPFVAVWPRPWGFGFGFFPFFPVFFVLFWVFVLRGLFWRRAWWGRGYGHHEVPRMFDEWHRRAHAQQAPPAADPRL